MRGKGRRGESGRGKEGEGERECVKRRMRGGVGEKRKEDE